MREKLVDRSSEWDARRCKRIIRRLNAPLASFKTSVENFPNFLQRGTNNEFLNYPDSVTGFEELPLDANGGTYPTETTKSKQPDIFDIFNQSKLNLRGIEYNASTEIEPYLQRTHKTLMKVLTLEASIESTKTIQSFINFFSMVYFATPSSKLTSLSALEVGRCIVYTSGNMDDKDWYDNVENLSPFTRWILMGHGLGLISKNANILEPLLPCIILCCALIEENAEGKDMYFTRKMVETFLQVISPRKFWKQMNSIKKLLEIVTIPEEILYPHMIRLMDYNNLNNHVFLDMAELISQGNRESIDINDILIGWFQALNQVEPGPLTSNPNIITGAKSLVKLYFECYVIPNHALLDATWIQRKCTDLLTEIPSLPEFDVIRRVIKLHIYYFSAELYTILPDIDHSPRFVRYVSNIYQSFHPFQDFVEFIIGVDPGLASSLASVYASRNNNIQDVKVWHANLIARAEGIIYGPYDESENNHDKKTQIVRGYNSNSRSATPALSQTPIKSKSGSRSFRLEHRNEVLKNEIEKDIENEEEGLSSRNENLLNLKKCKVEGIISPEGDCNISYTKNIYQATLSPEKVMNDFQIEYDSDLYSSEDHQSDDEQDNSGKEKQSPCNINYQGVEKTQPDDSIIEYSFDDDDINERATINVTPESSSKTREKLKQKYSDLPIIGLQNWSKKHTPSPNKSRIDTPDFFEGNIPVLDFSKMNKLKVLSKDEDFDQSKQQSNRVREFLDTDDDDDEEDFDLYNDKPYSVASLNAYDSPIKRNDPFNRGTDFTSERGNSAKQSSDTLSELEHQNEEEGNNDFKYVTKYDRATNLLSKRDINNYDRHQEINNEGMNKRRKYLMPASEETYRISGRKVSQKTFKFAKEDQEENGHIYSRGSRNEDKLPRHVNNINNNKMTKKRNPEDYEEFEDEENDEVCLI